MYETIHVYYLDVLLWHIPAHKAPDFAHTFFFSLVQQKEKKALSLTKVTSVKTLIFISSLDVFFFSYILGKRSIHFLSEIYTYSLSRATACYEYTYIANVSIK